MVIDPISHLTNQPHAGVSHCKVSRSRLSQHNMKNLWHYGVITEHEQKGTMGLLLYTDRKVLRSYHCTRTEKYYEVITVHGQKSITKLSLYTDRKVLRSYHCTRTEKYYEVITVHGQKCR